MVHIEGSLGQVAVSTCYSPRRAISAVHAVQAQSPLEVTLGDKFSKAPYKCCNLPLVLTYLLVTGTKRHQTTAVRGP